MDLQFATSQYLVLVLRSPIGGSPWRFDLEFEGEYFLTKFWYIAFHHSSSDCVSSYSIIKLCKAGVKLNMGQPQTPKGILQSIMARTNATNPSFEEGELLKI